MVKIKYEKNNNFSSILAITINLLYLNINDLKSLFDDFIFVLIMIYGQFI